MTHNPASGHDKPPGLFQYITADRHPGGNKLNSGRTYPVGNERLNLRQVVERTTANMNRARRDIVEGAMSAEDFIKRYSK